MPASPEIKFDLMLFTMTFYDLESRILKPGHVQCNTGFSHVLGPEFGGKKVFFGLGHLV
jgi:hypothetical protein